MIVPHTWTKRWEINTLKVEIKIKTVTDSERYTSQKMQKDDILSILSKPIHAVIL